VEGDKIMHIGKAALGGIFASLVAMTAPAQAGPMSYVWVPLTASGEVSGNPVGLFSLGSIGFASALAGNNFNFHTQCGLGPFCAPEFFTGNFGAVSIQTNISGKMFPIIDVTVGVTFNGDGTLSGTVRYIDTGADYFLSGSGNAWSGSFNSDLINCRNPTPCAATGYWLAQGPIQAPEPFTLSLFGAGLVGAAALRRKTSR
jgi:hypothetical protein